MTREILAMILLAVLIAGIGIAIVRMRRNSFQQTYRRSLRRDLAARQGGRRR